MYRVTRQETSDSVPPIAPSESDPTEDAYNFEESRNNPTDESQPRAEDLLATGKKDPRKRVCENQHQDGYQVDRIAGERHELFC